MYIGYIGGVDKEEPDVGGYGRHLRKNGNPPAPQVPRALCRLV